MGTNERTTTSLSRMGGALEALLKAPNDCWSQEKKASRSSSALRPRTMCMLNTNKNRGLLFMERAPPSQQLSLKRVLYLRWQQWSHSPGLIYLRDGIMNSLWHLIWPSLLIWVSAGIWTLIRAAHAPSLSRCACTDLSAISCELITCAHVPSGTLV